MGRIYVYVCKGKYDDNPELFLTAVVQAAIPISPIHLSFFWMLFGSGGFRSDIFMGHDGGVHLRKNSKEAAFPTSRSRVGNRVSLRFETKVYGCIISEGDTAHARMGKKIALNVTGRHSGKTLTCG